MIVKRAAVVEIVGRGRRRQGIGSREEEGVWRWH